MNLVNATGIKIYNISAGKSIPDWISERKKRSLKKQQEYERKIELIQDLDFGGAAQRIKTSSDGKFLAASGVYKPQIKLFELDELSMKCERHVDCEISQFQFLSDDWTKIALLELDRTVEFHAQFGSYYKLRIPKFGRDMTYLDSKAELYIPASGKEIYRINLERGRFLEPFSSSSVNGVNVSGNNQVHDLLAFGCENGNLECFDPRERKCISKLPISLSSSNSTSCAPITALRFDDALELAVGNADGKIALFDIRSSRPKLIRDHQYDLPIVDIKFHTPNGREETVIISADSKIVKIWDKNEAIKVKGNIEPPADVNDVCIYPDTGLLFLALEQPKIETYYIPELGNAPGWCYFLDSITEELEESSQTAMYDDYKFVTQSELERFGLEKMIGTPYLRAYMHGYFMDIRLYNNVKNLAEPFSYQEYIKQKIQEKRQKRYATRINKKRKLPAVNKQLAIQMDETTNEPKIDPRFGDLFKKQEFQVDEKSEAYQRVKASAQRLQRKYQRELHEEKLEAEDDEEEVDTRTSTSSAKKATSKRTRSRPDNKISRSIIQEQKEKRRMRSKESIGDKLKRINKEQAEKSANVVSISKRSGNRQLTFVPKRQNVVPDKKEIKKEAKKQKRNRRQIF